MWQRCRNESIRYHSMKHGSSQSHLHIERANRGTECFYMLLSTFSDLSYYLARLDPVDYALSQLDF